MRRTLQALFTLMAVGQLTGALAEQPTGQQPEVALGTTEPGGAEAQLNSPHSETGEEAAITPFHAVPPHAAGYASYAATAKRRRYSVYGHYCCATFNYRWVFDYPWHGPAYGPVAHAPYQIAKRDGTTRASDSPPAPLPPKLHASVSLDSSRRGTTAQSSQRPAKTR